ncbi:MAG: lytic murein transglycosylase B [Betaproteobacteria bacterium]|nr:lytic murein transglycosylase B [Betaproteobacteria bacterium]
MSARHLLLALLLAALATTARAEEEAPESYALRADVAGFIHDLVERHAFDADELRLVFSRARREDAVLAAMRAQPRQADSWHAYRSLFVNERHVRAGLEFWREQRKPLARARSAYGVPEEIIVAIIGIETFYGRNTGRWRVIDALATLAFDYPPRALFFRKELENYLLFVRQLELDVFSVKGSYAGAIGIPQFMPGSYLRYAVDFDGDGNIDLRGNAADAVGSVANFLQRHGWQRGAPVQRGARITGEGFESLVAADPLPQHTLEELAGAGVEVRGAPLPADTRAALLRLETPEQPADFRVGLQNFYVLTRYNRSLFYALSVAELAEQLRAARGKARAAPPAK